MILAVVGQSSRERSAVAYQLGAQLNAVVVDGALELCREETGGPDVHDVLAGRASPIEAVCEDGPVAIAPCWRPVDQQSELTAVLEPLEREYGSVLIDCPTTPWGTPNAVVVTSQRAVVGELSRKLDAEIAAIALLGAETTVERTSVPVTPIPRLPSIHETRTDPIDRAVERAFRRLAAAVHASVRS